MWKSATTTLCGFFLDVGTRTRYADCFPMQYISDQMEKMYLV